MKKEILAIIPARGGSKGLPGKNIRPLAGKPLIAYAIEAAKASKYITRTVVSTDDPEIARISKEFGAEVPFMRPDDLANDGAKGIDVIIHAIEWLREHEGYRPDFVVNLQPTSPLRTHIHVDQAVELFEKTSASTVVSVCESEHSPFWTCTIHENRLVPLLKVPDEGAGRQQLPKTYRYNGAIYISTPQYLLEKRSFIGDTEPYIMSQEDSVDIDTLLDFRLAELILSNR